MHPLFEKASGLTDETKTSTGGSRERREHLLGSPCDLPFNLKNHREMMNGSKPGGPSGGFQAPSPMRRRPGLRESCSPSPQPSPRGEGECWDGAGIFGRDACGPPLLCLSFRRHTTTKLGRLTKARANVSPSPRGEGWGEGERSKLQSQAPNGFRNCQTSRVPRQSRGSPNLIITRIHPRRR